MTDAEADLEFAATWLQREQGIKLQKEKFQDAVGTSVMVGELVRKSAATLPFDTEPSRHAWTLHRLAAKGRRP